MLSFLILLHVVYQFSLQSHILFQEETQNSVNFPPLLQKQSSKWPTAKNATLYYFDAESVEPENSIWVVKWISKKLFLGDKCDYLVQRIQESQKKTSNSPVVLIVDRGDSSSFHKSNCPERIASLVGPQNQYLAMRNLVNNRNFGCMSITAPTCYSETQLFTDLYGEPWNYSLQPFTKHIHNGCIAKVDFPVRESLLNDIEARLGHEDIDQFRTKGVGHFWTIEPGDKYGQLRNRVTQTIQELLENSTTITGTAGLVSTRGRSGRVFVSERYVDALLEHKIVVVCQRDHWEGHLRLMEALVSGGLVLTDPIMHMPAGFVDGENIVIYNSLKDLKKKIGYYLSPGGTRARKTIAKAGRRLAIEHHKAEHMFQRLAYGRWPRDAASPVIDIV
eukprot:scaffold5281_cov127-Cylindrotheca_fusiformis.AAC.10